MKELVQAVALASRLAGAEIKKIQQSKRFLEKAKADHSPVTTADLASHEILVKALESLTPKVPVISEESGASEAEMLEVITGASEYWLVDPLDGTRDFLTGSGEFCTCVALVRNGRPVLGVIHEPMADRTYAGFVGGSDLKTRRADPRPLFLISRLHPGGEEDRLRRTLPAARTQKLGSALKYARIAAGEADASVRFTPTSLWDVAAGEALLNAAGGGIRALAGGLLDYSGKVLVLPPLLAAGDLAMLDRFADQLVHALD